MRFLVANALLFGNIEFFNVSFALKLAKAFYKPNKPFGLSH
jgi:hypothetical protein